MSLLFCDDFLFRGRRMSDFGLVNATFDDSGLSPKEIGLKKTLHTARTGTSPVTGLYGVSYDGPLVFEGILMRDGAAPIPMETFREVVRWLTADSYERLYVSNQFCEGTYFNCVFSDIRLYENQGLPIGIAFEVTCDAPYAWEELSVTGTSPMTVNVQTDDVLNPVRPRFRFTCEVSGPAAIFNETTGERLCLDDMLAGETCKVDTGRFLLISDIPERNFYSSFNRVWPSLAPGENVISFTGFPSLEITAALPRKVGY